MGKEKTEPEEEVEEIVVKVDAEACRTLFRNR